jgi:DMSO/TMAO reductase YedYZ molybdopterin-dependent catalytic subunit
MKAIHLRTAIASVLVFSWALSIRAGQSEYAIRVIGDVEQPLTLTAAHLAKMPRASLPNRNNTIERAWEGVWLSEILKRAGVPMGTALRGSALAAYVVVSGSDGYQVVFSLGELDPDMTDGRFLVADTANGTQLVAEGEGFRIVIPGDKQGARSVRMLSTIEVVRLRK